MIKKYCLQSHEFNLLCIHDTCSVDMNNNFKFCSRCMYFRFLLYSDILLLYNNTVVFIYLYKKKAKEILNTVTTLLLRSRMSCNMQNAGYRGLN